MVISIIKIPDSIFREYSNNNAEMLEKAILNGILFQDNATNGDVIKALFPNVHCNETCNEMLVLTDLDGETTRFLKSWWNAPYKAGDTDEN